MCACGCLISLDSLKFAGCYVTCASKVYCKSNRPTFQENIAFSFPLSGNSWLITFLLFSVFLSSAFGNLSVIVTIVTFLKCHCNSLTLFLWSVPAALAYCRVELVYSLHVNVCLYSVLLLNGTTQERSEVVLVSLSIAFSVSQYICVFRSFLLFCKAVLLSV